MTRPLLAAGAPWRRAPLMLVRRLGVAAAVSTAALVAVLPATAAPVFLDAAGSATLTERTSAVCPATLGSQASVPEYLGPDGHGSTMIGRRAQAEAATVGRVRGIGPAVATVYATKVPMEAGAAHETVTVLTRSDAAAHITVLSGTTGAGLWISDRLAARDGIHIGDRLTLSGPDVSTGVSPPDSNGVQTSTGSYTPKVTLPVVAVYRDLRDPGESPFWCGLDGVIRGDELRGGEPADDVILGNTSTMTTMFNAVYLPVTVSFDRGPARGVDGSLAAAAATAGAIHAAQASLLQTWRAQHDYGSHMVATSQLGDYVARARLVKANLGDTITPITVAGSVVGLVLIAAAAVFWVRRRRSELLVLATHGSPAWSLGLKAVLEAAPAIAVGAMVAWWLAQVMVGRLGPTGSAGGASVTAAVVTAVAMLVVVSVVAAWQCRDLGGSGRRRARRWVRRVPWEALLTVAAILVWAKGDNRRVVQFQDTLGAVAHMPTRLLVMPMLAIAATAVAALRGYGWLAGRPGRSRPTQGVVTHLTSARLRHSVAGGAVVLLVTAVPVAYAIFGATAVGSVQGTLADQARLTVGADVVITLDRAAPLPASMAGHAASVQRVNGVRVGSVDADVLAVDPDTFASAAFWSDSIDGRSMPALLKGLGSTAAGAPAVVASTGVTPGRQSIGSSDTSVGQVTVRTVGTLPAEQGGFPVIIVDRAVLYALGPALSATAVDQIWVSGDPDTIRREAVAAGLPMSSFRAARDLYVGTYFQPFTYTFAYLAALSLLTGLVGAVGLVLYIESRLPSYRRGFVMLRAMSLSGARHLAVMAGEIAVPVVVGCAIGAAAAAGLLALLHGEFAIDQSRPPGAEVFVSITATAGALGAAAVVAVAAVLTTQRRVIRSVASEVLRDSE